MSARASLPAVRAGRDGSKVRLFVRRYRWFRGRTGVVGRDAESALHLARAEETAERRGWAWSWETDEYPDLSWCDRCERGETRFHSHDVYTCVLTDCAGRVLSSLGGIDSPDNDYRRQIEAELASEALCEGTRGEGAAFDGL